MENKVTTKISKLFPHFVWERLANIDWVLFVSAVLIAFGGLVTMNSFVEEQNHFFEKQIIWISISIVLFLVVSFFDFRFLRRTGVVVLIFIVSCAVLSSLFVVGHISKGAQSWFSLGSFSVQPSDLAKLVLILVLAKYFTRRHVEIAHIRHILVSGIYAFVLFFLILLQPDFGGAIIIFILWFGMVMVSGISKKHLTSVVLIGAIAFCSLWFFVFQDYQKQRIITFVDPLSDVRGAGYNAYQSMIAVGSGQFLGKGVGYGTQSKLKFLPEYQTDFIFAAFAEEWGFVGIITLFALFGVVIWRILRNALWGATNFEMLFGMGVAILFMINFIINIGMNIGLLPVTGITLPFMSYGGSHLIAEFLALGILVGMKKYNRSSYKESVSLHLQ
ncbi:rod shape-determining protein RodA [Candidatus Parcubacteria bacterium]|nr:rod shape-determining protein RodA [Candidatus Parcubacteria bacterium]